MNRLSVELIETDDTADAAHVVVKVLKALLKTNGSLVSRRTSVNGYPEIIVDIPYDDANAERFLDAVYGAGNHDGVEAHLVRA